MVFVGPAKAEHACIQVRDGALEADAVERMLRPLANQRARFVDQTFCEKIAQVIAASLQRSRQINEAVVDECAKGGAAIK
ncbi:hypothetical protein D3C85_937040 [compost metagenome]